MEFTSWNPNELYHYGVLGMKWGQRRYQNADGSLTEKGKKHYAETGEYGYHYKSHATKKYTRKAAKQWNKVNKLANKIVEYESKGNTAATNKAGQRMRKAAMKSEKYKKRAQLSSELDAREQANASQVSIGKAIATRLLFGDGVSKGYQQMLAMMNGSVKGAGASTGKKTIARLMAAYGGSYGSRILKAGYIRQNEASKLGKLTKWAASGYTQTANTIDKVHNKVKTLR